MKYATVTNKQEFLSDIFVFLGYFLGFGSVVAATAAGWSMGLEKYLGSANIVWHHFWIMSCMVVSPIFLFPVFLAWRKQGVAAFCGFSWFIGIILLLLFLRLCLDSHNVGAGRFGSLAWVAFLSIICVPVLFFSIPLSEKQRRVAWWGVLCALTFATCVLGALYYPYILKGVTVRAPMYPMSVVMQNRLILLALCLLFFALYSLIESKKSRTFFLFSLLYLAASFGLHLSGGRSALLMSIATTFAIFLIPSFRRSFQKIVTVFLIIIMTNAVSSYVVTRNCDSQRTAFGRVKMLAQSVYFGQKKLRNDFFSSNNPVTPSVASTLPAVAAQISPKSPAVAAQVSPKSPAVAAQVSPKSHLEFVSIESKINKASDAKSLAKSVLGARGTFWVTALERIAENPFGTGLQDKATGRTTSNTHNSYLSVFEGTGILGGILFLIVVAVGLHDACFTLRKIPGFGWIGLLYIFECLLMLSGGRIEVEPYFWFPLVALRANVYFYKTEQRCQFGGETLTHSGTMVVAPPIAA